MPISPARTAAFDILLRVEQTDAYSSELLHSSHYSKLMPSDHRLAMELTMGVLRWRSLLDRQIAQHSSAQLVRLDLEVLTALRLAAYQLQFLDRIPARSAVHESGQLVKRARKRSAVGFVNAILRKLAETSSPDAAAGIANAQNTIDLAEASAHPPWLVERWKRQFGFPAACQICAHNQRLPEPALVRPETELEWQLQEEGVTLSPGKLLATARRITAGNVSRSSSFRKGRLILQDEASQLVAMLAGKGSQFLDCCAAPGGKTRILAQRNPAANILAVDLHPHRARLMRNLVHSNHVHVIAADACQLPLAAEFDVVLADVPCSGTGTLARNPEIKWRLKPEDLTDLQRRQLAILRSAMQNVALNGRLVYSTCSLEPEENSEVIQQALAGGSSFHAIDCVAELERLQQEGELIWPDLKSLSSRPYLRTIPGIHPADGFFAAILQKH